MPSKSEGGRELLICGQPTYSAGRPIGGCADGFYDASAVEAILGDSHRPSSRCRLSLRCFGSQRQCCVAIGVAGKLISTATGG
eukprot:6206069-Pleurochrysis_carterae.AAC.6